MKNIWKYAIPAILGMIIGALLYHVLLKPDPPLPVMQPPETPRIEPETVKPDTVRIIQYVKVPSKLPTSPPVEPDDVTNVASVDDDIEAAPGIPYYESEITFYYDENLVHNPKLKEDGAWLARTKTWAWSVAPVDSFKQLPTIRWNQYYTKFI
jgi:hypothetical protein